MEYFPHISYDDGYGESGNGDDGDGDGDGDADADADADADDDGDANLNYRQGQLVASVRRARSSPRLQTDLIIFQQIFHRIFSN